MCPQKGPIMAKMKALDAIKRIVAADFYARRQLEETETEGNPVPPAQPTADQRDTPRS
jgi:hypothetical protein